MVGIECSADELEEEMKVIVELSKMTTTTFILAGLDRVFTLEEDLNESFYSFYN